jgi:hypothetical protein
VKKSLVSSRGRVRLVPVECLIIRVLLRADQVINSELMSAYGPWRTFLVALECPLSGVKRTPSFDYAASACDPDVWSGRA